MGKGKRRWKKHAGRRENADRGNGRTAGTAGGGRRTRMWTILAGAVLVLFIILILAVLESVKEELLRLAGT